MQLFFPQCRQYILQLKCWRGALHKQARTRDCGTQGVLTIYLRRQLSRCQCHFCGHRRKFYKVYLFWNQLFVSLQTGDLLSELLHPFLLLTAVILVTALLLFLLLLCTTLRLILALFGILRTFFLLLFFRFAFCDGWFYRNNKSVHKVNYLSVPGWQLLFSVQHCPWPASECPLPPSWTDTEPPSWWCWSGAQSASVWPGLVSQQSTSPAIQNMISNLKMS